MRLYHGSSQIVAKPKFGVGRTNNDFGLGFYCSDDEALAAEWAAGPDRNGFVSVYAFDDSGLRGIDLCSSQYTIMHWLSLLMDYREFDSSSMLLHRAGEYIHRNFPVDYQSCDYISGYRADNVNFTLAQLFLNGQLSFQELRHYLTSEGHCRQYVIKSNRAFERVSYVGYTAAYSEDIYPMADLKEIRIMQNIYKEKKKRGLFISRMMEEDIKAYDSRLQ